MSVIGHKPCRPPASPRRTTTRRPSRPSDEACAATVSGSWSLTTDASNTPRFDQLGDHLRVGDVLVINTSATLPGQLDAFRDGRRLVVHLANRLADGSRVVELRSAPDAARPLLDGRAGEQIELPVGGELTLLEPYPAPDSSPTGRGNRLWRGAVSVPGRLLPYLETHARPISYGYLRDSVPLAAYQTIFAVHPGSAEMPSAGSPFSAELVARLVAGGVIFAPIPCTPGCHRRTRARHRKPSGSRSAGRRPSW